MTNAPASPTDTLTARLKSENWDMHQIAEHSHGQGSVLRGELSLPAYIELIDQGYLVHRALDEAAQHAMTLRPDLAPLMAEEHLLGQHFAKDLAHFGVSPDNTEPLPGTERFIAHIEAVKDEPLKVLGLHYVRTGASNGNSFVAKHAREAFDLPATGEGTAHLVPYGDRQRAAWGAFKAQLDSLPLSSQEQDTVIASARAMYAHYICWHREAHLSADELVREHAASLDKTAFDKSHAVPNS